MIVVITHICRATDTTIFYPADDEEAIPRLLQYPVIRIPFQGRISVTIFALVTGFVCSLKPLRQSRTGQRESALAGIARSSFRRFPRLALPPFIATVAIWILCQLGAFEIARATDSAWLAATSPKRALTIGQALNDLIFNQITTWTTGIDLYDVNFWTMMPLYKGACIVYILCFATIWSKPRYRMMMTLAAFVYYYICSDGIPPQLHPVKSFPTDHSASFGMQFTWGMFLADLSNHPPAIDYAASHTWVRRFFAPFCIIIGLVFASYPEDHADWIGWSERIRSFLDYVLPPGADYATFASAFGLEFISLGILFSPAIKDILSHRYFLWLGKNSFAVYILHGTFVRTVLTWLLYGISLPVETVGENGELIPGDPITKGGVLGEIFVLPMFFVGLYAVAHYWTIYVEAWCAKCTRALESYVFEEGEKGTVLPMH